MKVISDLKKRYGIGSFQAQKVCASIGITQDTKIKSLPKKARIKMSRELKTYTLGSALKEEIRGNITKLKQIKCYRGVRHRNKLPTRGQRTRCNAKTIKRWKV